jgi:membrane AbrB-like protein
MRVRAKLPQRREMFPPVAGLTLGAAAGWLCSRVGTPIPWMMGPLVTVALLRVAGANVSAIPGGRQVGQWSIGTALGLYFTPAVVHEVTGWWPLLAVGAVFAIGMGYAAGVALAHMARIDRTTAIFASVPGGAFYGAPRFVFAVASTVIGAIFISAAFGWIAAALAGLYPATVVLGMTPGGIAEMSVTAKVLQLGVPLVTSFHVTRVVALLVCTAPLFVRVRAWRQHKVGAGK